MGNCPTVGSTPTPVARGKIGFIGVLTFYMMRLRINYLFIALSSSGRTSVFDADNGGSNPSEATLDFKEEYNIGRYASG